MATTKREIIRVGWDQASLRQKKSVGFVVLLTRLDLVLPLEKRVVIARKEAISRVYAVKVLP